ncbi:MAG: hypothetical protein UCI88_00305 [Megasphaera massiliensis]|uniref:hypothetical protein n=2 Tax=Megasphaera massiliensis TaxID=1232428 RepID=UPI00210C5581|nr:hypothetical protein [Megasphaera massiliensis]MCQ5211221.1 hypothetical protein [Megasphaera massiliensis]MEE0657532.1 hypothetical protein [Megasphaera massiliensis]
MFKKMAVLIVAFSVLLGGLCMADKAGPLPASEASLGGITLRSPMSYVRSIYGSPAERYMTKNRFNTKAVANRYGKGFYVIEYADKAAVEELYVNAHNGIATPMGVAVGVPKSTVDRLYGSSTYSQGKYYYYTRNAIAIMIVYGNDTNGVTVVKSINIQYQS